MTLEEFKQSPMIRDVKVHDWGITYDYDGLVCCALVTVPEGVADISDTPCDLHEKPDTTGCPVFASMEEAMAAIVAEGEEYDE